MKTNHRHLIALVLLFFLLVACTFPIPLIWGIGGIQAPVDMIGTEIFGESTITPETTAAEAGSQEVNCAPGYDAFEWSYEGFQQSSGTGGVACNASFVFRNTSDRPFYLLMFTEFDNNAMQLSRWEKHLMQPGDEWVERVNRTNYTDGTITFSRVSRYTVIWDVPECAPLLSEGNEDTWDMRARNVEEITCR